MAKTQTESPPDFLDPSLQLLAPELLPSAKYARDFVMSAHWHACHDAIQAVLDLDRPIGSLVANDLYAAAMRLLHDLATIAAYSHRAEVVFQADDWAVNSEEPVRALQLLQLSMHENWTRAREFGEVVEAHCKAILARPRKEA
jgi:hypothetical protein